MPPDDVWDGLYRMKYDLLQVIPKDTTHGMSHADDYGINIDP